VLASMCLFVPVRRSMTTSSRPRCSTVPVSDSNLMRREWNYKEAYEGRNRLTTSTCLKTPKSKQEMHLCLAAIREI
jgi:hypothetical protein